MGFQIGDMVTIYRKIEPPEWRDLWSESMTQMIGQSYPVTMLSERGCKVGGFWFPVEALAFTPTGIAKRDGVRVVYDISSAARTAQMETRLGVWDTNYEYHILGTKYGVEFVENVIDAEGLIQYIHLEPWRNDSDEWTSPEVSELVIDELLANGWRLADG
jgi:hypothetical protein